MTIAVDLGRKATKPTKPTKVTSATVHSKAVVLLLFIPCLLFLPLLCGDLVFRSLFSFAVLCALSSFAIISLGKRELAVLLLLCSE